MDIQAIKERFESLGFQTRTSQLEMMARIQETIDQGGITVIEGGTGIGKTFGYLIPALFDENEHRKVVVSTATVNLQMQLIEKDLPLVSTLLNREIRAEIAKGRRRYVCLSRLFSAHAGVSDASQLNLLGIESDVESEPSSATSDLFAALVDQIDEGWSGDRDALPVTVQDHIWQKVSTDASGCSGRRCAHIRECPFFKARSKLKNAEVIIANHDVLLSDLVMGSGVLLPDSAETLYILDEAHHFPLKALEHFSSRTSFLGVRQWVSKLGVMSRRLRVIMPEMAESLASFDLTFARMQETLTHLYEAFLPKLQTLTQEWVLSGTGSGDRFGSDEIGPFVPLIERLLNDAKPLQTLLYLFRKTLSDSHTDKTLPDFDPILQALGMMIQRNHTVIRTWELFISQDSLAVSPIAKWIALPLGKKDVAGSLDFYVHAAYTSADRMLPEFFWGKKTKGIILCSATLRSLGSFDSFLKKTGLQGHEKLSCHAFSSPFDYAKSYLSLPPMKSDPAYENNREYVLELTDHLTRILGQETQGTLVLFTSKKMMEAAFDGLPESIKGSILMQGVENKSQLLQRHKGRIDAHIPSVIFGLQSFAEGVDLPGNYCRHVVITKLPFSVPSTPIEQTFVHWMSLRQEDAFLNHTLPEASLRLNQFAGRLIRHESDTGTLTILDNRILKKRYGKQLLQALPAFSKL
jgi:ATP-dependent DNA helicase DinG